MPRIISSKMARDTPASTPNTSIASTSSHTMSDYSAGSSVHPSVTQHLVDTGKYYCPFLERGFCRQSTRCNFSHDCQTSTKIPIDYCHFYLANQCLYGQYCKFIHDEPLALAAGPIDDDFSRPENRTPTGCDEESENHNQYIYYDSDSVEVQQAAYNGEQHHGSRSPIDSRSDGLSEGLNTQSGSRVRFLPALPAHRTNVTSCQVNSSAQSVTSHDTKLTTDDQSAQNRSSKSPSTQGTNFLPLRALVAGGPSSSSSTIGGDEQNSSKLLTSRVIDAAKDLTASTATTTKAWQGGRLLASLKGESSTNNGAPQLKDLPLCPFSMSETGCPYSEGCCNYVHGMVCDLCGLLCLHPYDEAQRRKHRDDCLREHEREMELSFAVQRSKDKICGICMDIVVEKKPVTTSRFGILEKCNHIFCLDCIRKWRGTKQFDSKTIRACPECRVNSDFVVPSKYWIEDQDDKDKLIHDYKAALRSKPCRYFDEGKGECPFAGSCFYRHAYPDGSLAEEEAPKPRRRLYGARGSTTLANYVLWSLIRSFDDDDWSTNDDESDSRFYIDNDDEYDYEDYDVDEEEVEDDVVGGRSGTRTAVQFGAGEEDDGDDDGDMRARILIL